MASYIGDLLLLFTFLSILVASVSYYYEAVLGFENKVPISEPIDTRSADSLVGCAMSCGSGCKCFNFNHHTGMCISYQSCHAFNMTKNEFGWQLYYRLPLNTLVLSNIALGKPATQSTTHYGYNAAYAVDGNRGTDIYVDRCTVTDYDDTNPWWRVDLQAVYNIKTVRILNRGIDKYGDLSFRLRDVTVTVGLTESDVNTPCGFFAGPGTASQLVVIDCTTLPRGRFVNISKTTEHLTLCEVDVFGVVV
ncbi:fucolectin-like [Magallana gigas]|uniref:fucolectin-like n=1 Tax=Magallana gigas TaxID=29159 RepID=UPI0033426CF4